jgi:zinc protease
MAAWVEPAAHQSVLGNGLKLVVIERHERPLVAVRLFFPAGAAGEPAARSGCTWLALSVLEDRVEKRNEAGIILVSDEKSARRQLIEAGASLGFRVSHDAAWLSVDGYSRDLGRYLEALRDVLLTRRHGTDAFSDHRDGLLDAIDDRELSDYETLLGQLARATFGAQSPYARHTTGSLTSLNALGMEDIVACQETLLKPSGATLLVVGDVDAQQVLAQARTALHGWSSASRPLASTAVPIAAGPRQQVLVIKRMPARTSTVCAARAFPAEPSRDAALSIVAEALSDSLQQALREEQGLTYGVQSGVLRYRYASALVFCATLPTQRTEEGLLLLVRTVKAFGAAPSDLERARVVVRARLEAGRADLHGLLDTWSSALELARPPELGAQQATLDAVTGKQLTSLASSALALDQLQVVLSGDPDVISRAIKASGLGRAVLVKNAKQ